VLAGILPMVPALGAVTMQAATARVEITPSALGFATYFRAGYAGLQPVTQASAPLYATGLLVVDSAGRRSVVVSADVLAFPAALTTRIQGTVQTMYGIPPERVLLVGTHTHTGPVLVDQPNLWTTYGIAAGSPEEQLVADYSDAFVTRVNELVSTLLAAPLQDVVAATGYGLAGGLAYNRASSPLDRATASDPNVAVLTLRAAATQAVGAVVFSYAMHAVSLHDHKMWDSDYPGATVSALEGQLVATSPGARALYLPGAGGDQDPIGGLGPARISPRCPCSRATMDPPPPMRAGRWSTSKAITGVPPAIASSATRPNVSASEGTMTTADAASQPAT